MFAIRTKKTLIYAAFRAQNQGKEKIHFPLKSLFYCVISPQQNNDEVMAVFRVGHNKGYIVISNYHLRNKELSLKAKGLLSQMLSLPEDWDYTLARLSHIDQMKESNSVEHYPINVVDFNYVCKSFLHRKSNV